MNLQPIIFQSCFSLLRLIRFNSARQIADPVHEVQEGAFGLGRGLPLHSFVSRGRTAKVLRLDQEWRELKEYRKK